MLTVTWGHPYRESASVVETSVALTLYQVALSGRGYVLDLASNQFAWESIETMRPQQDTGDEPGGQSLSNMDLWRRSFLSWHFGAGQQRGDDETSSPFRFYSSKGIDPWTKWRISLLPSTSVVDSGVNTPSAVAVLGSNLIHQSGTVIRKSADGTTWSAVTTLAATPYTRIVSDGTKLWVACNDGKIKSVTSTGTTVDEFTLANVDVLALSKGRLWAGVGTALHALVPGTPPVTPGTAHLTHPFPGWVWTDVCEGPRATYAAGYSGDKSQVYRIPFKTDGSGLDSGVIAASLPDGEIVYSMTSYLGYIVLGTSAGLRFAVPDEGGDLTYGPLVPTGAAVKAFEAQDRFVWYGLTNYDATSTGLGRLDLSTFTSDLTPAYASDLMYTGSGVVSSAVTFGGKRYFTVEGVGVVGQGSGQVASGQIVQSEVTYDLANPKIASLLDLTHDPLDGIVSVYLSTDGGTFGLIGESSEQNSYGPGDPMQVNQIEGIRFQVKMVLTDGDASGPVVTGATLLSNPVPPAGMRFLLPIRLAEEIEYENVTLRYDPVEELAFLTDLWRARRAVTLQIGGQAYAVFPVNFRWIPYRQMLDKSGWQGTVIMELREVTR